MKSNNTYCVYACMCLSVRIYVCMCVCMHSSVCVCVRMCLCMLFVRMYEWMHAVFLYTCTYMYVSINTLNMAPFHDLLKALHTWLCIWYTQTQLNYDLNCMLRNSLTETPIISKGKLSSLFQPMAHRLMVSSRASKLSRYTVLPETCNILWTTKGTSGGFRHMSYFVIQSNNKAECARDVTQKIICTTTLIFKYLF